MARYRSKAEIQKDEMNRYTRIVVSDADLRPQVNTLINSWGENIPDDYSKQIYALIRQSAVLQQVPEKDWMRQNVATQANEELKKPLLQIRLRQEREREKQRITAFHEAAKNRPIVDEGMFRSSSEPGDIVRMQENNKPDRLLTCISCEYINAPEDYGQYESGYLIKYAEPTEEEKQSEQYQRAKKAMDIDLEYKETLRRNARVLLDRNEW